MNTATGHGNDRARTPDDQPAPDAQRKETHQTGEVPLGSGERPEPPGGGGDSSRHGPIPTPTKPDDEKESGPGGGERR
ncbi:hypothetical protein [Paraburkholderia caballeronis]|uniref:Uncharacterized protein n=1 Tax=Paraburkholderia caballeronis TaxID=416943 RepID=A0A1H7UGU4_9BURK|nr:hypothetical protein [Paraburkholderia caballeronis]PXW17520.1 hypothetical protein C7403_11858 [Paraburkholderia caballeronis]PXW95109.1 hypothetical protein C7407_11858 [Paraburkholderia caballeronis]RAJ90955.1 hypothetical protein C7409_11858 [Paraburkholderia caballeronis]TDV07826.1 hypothetical protein C7408_11945 [Paraburkholderia caballeronis]TDV11189.1 hypothetical protein C7406_12245 [Paraburkholderia caballeronis]